MKNNENDFTFIVSFFSAGALGGITTAVSLIIIMLLAVSGVYILPKEMLSWSTFGGIFATATLVTFPFVYFKAKKEEKREDFASLLTQVLIFGYVCGSYCGELNACCQSSEYRDTSVANAVGRLLSRPTTLIYLLLYVGCW